MLYTIENKTQSEIKIKRSRFICTLYPLPHAENVKDLLNEHCHLYATAIIIMLTFMVLTKILLIIPMRRAI